MAVPDWPTSYGYNMFLFPVSQWVGGVFYEHTHRLAASAVGLLTTILAIGLWMKEERRWVRRLGVLAWVAVCVQGLLGGLRVTLYKQELGIFHAALAQVFLITVSAIAFVLSAKWHRLVGQGRSIRFHRWFRRSILASTLLILGQLVIGATMRHQHAGLAVPDFPLAYGRVWPQTDANVLEKVNRSRLDYRDFAPITAAQIYLHMAHRFNACLILAFVLFSRYLAGKGEANIPMRRLTNGWLGLILFQAFLGAYTIWSNKAADVATAHVAFGAASLVAGALLYLATAPVAAPSRFACESALPQGTPALIS